jgi:anaerobic magnesium-protoporphyrin IX monomethyl ester cyclase
MKIMVVNPPRVSGYSVVREEKFEHKDSGSVYPPLSLLYASAVLENAGYDVQFIDANGFDMNLGDVKAKIKKADPDIVVSRTGFDTQFEDLLVLDHAKSLGAKTIVRNTIISETPWLRDQFVKNRSIDFFMNQEPESVILKLVDAVGKNKNLKTVPGISFVKAGKVITTQKAPLANIDDMPFPAYHLIKTIKPYNSGIFSDNFSAVLSSRGCPFHCTFCAFGRTPCRMRSPDNVVSELEYLKSHFGLKNFIFFDDTFTLNRDRAKKICNLMVERKLDLEWGACTRANLVDAKILSIMKKSGCREIAFGIESGSPKILQTIKKGVSLDAMRLAAGLCRKYRILFSALVIIGLPGETRETVQESVDFIKEIDAFYTQFCYAVPFPNSEMYDYYVKNNFLLSKDWSRFCPIDSPIIRTSELMPQDLVQLRKEAYMQLLLRPRYLLSKVSLTDWSWNVRGASKLLSRIYSIVRDRVVR